MSARMTQLPGLQATHRKKTSTFLDTDIQVEHVCSCCKVDRKNTTLFLTFIRVCVLELGQIFTHWEMMRNSLDLAGYFLFLLHTGSGQAV